ncbi:MAG: hypothetical protein FD155_347 [Bacteroidetes bacterium]|nr:MAG: hypothetical protein FD155_347 [Bacteroidota bacterium]
MKGICRLYDIEDELLESHIFPKFTIDYFKMTGSKYLRNFIQPNKRLQDGPKTFLLSQRAEHEFSLREKWFAENIFIPYLTQNRRVFKYDENLFYFSVSLLWRALLININHPNVVVQPFLPLLKEAENEWKLFLKDYKFPMTHNRSYLFFTDRIIAHNIETAGVDYYMTRALDATIVSNQNETFVAVYAKFLRFIFWGILKGGDEVKISDLKINPLTGELRIPQKFEDGTMTSFFMSRIKELENLPKPSEKQQDKILDEILKDKEGFLKSDAGQSITNDYINLDPK